LAYLSRANAYHIIGKHDQAISDFTKALKLNSRFAEAYNGRGYVYLKTFKYDQAILDFTKALEIYPGFFEAFLLRGEAYMLINKFDQAIHDLNKAIEINPMSPNAYNTRGIVFLKTYLFDRAISDFTKAVEIDPTFGHAYYNRGLAYSSKREYEKALEALNKGRDFGVQLPPLIFDDLRKFNLRYRSSNTPYFSPPKLRAGFGFWFSGLPNDYSIQAILEDGPAARAGLKIGDIILKINNIDVTTLTSSKSTFYYGVSIGEKWTFTVLQDGIEKEIELIAGEPK
jgi:tetratricopeptide (TPR) repeat protein